MLGTGALSAAMAAVLVVLSASLVVTMAAVDENAAAVRLGAGSDGGGAGAPQSVENGRGCGAVIGREKSLVEKKSLLEFLEDCPHGLVTGVATKGQWI